MSFGRGVCFGVSVTTKTHRPLSKEALDAISRYFSNFIAALVCSNIVCPLLRSVCIETTEAGREDGLEAVLGYTRELLQKLAV
jgi:hypothetical protein